MKVEKILQPVDLKEFIKPTDFAHNNARVAPDLPAKKILERFPFQPPWPSAHPDFARDTAVERNYKFLAEMKLGDPELIKFSYRRLKESADLKRLWTWRLKEKDADARAVELETDNQKHRIMETWAQRFYMEKVFAHLRITSMDEFKRIMHNFHVEADNRQLVQKERFLKQAGDDPGHNPAIRSGHRPGEVADLARMRLELDNRELIVLSDMRHKLAEQNAALITRSLTDTRLLRDLQQDLRTSGDILKAHAENYYKIKKA